MNELNAHAQCVPTSTGGHCGQYKGSGGMPAAIRNTLPGTAIRTAGRPNETVLIE
jgi:hypothetical protein